MLDERVNAGNGGLDAGQHHIFSEFFLVEDDHFFYVADATLEVFAESRDFANDNGRTRDGLEDAELAALNALGDFDFALAGKQRDGAHFAQVHAHGVVGFFKRAWGEVELDVFAFFEFEILVAGKFWGVEQIDALGADGGDQIIEIVSGANLIGQDVIDIAVGEIAFLFAYFNDVVDVVFEFIVNCQSVLLFCAYRFRHRSRTGAGLSPWRIAEIPKKKRNPARTDADLRLPAKKVAVSVHCSEQDDRASGFAWLAREPQLMCGAKGRTSSLRSIDYHSPPSPFQQKPRGTPDQRGLFLKPWAERICFAPVQPLLVRRRETVFRRRI